MKQKIFGVLQRVGRSFMLPIALLPVAGLLLGIGSSFTNPTTLKTFGLSGIIYEGGILYTVLDIMSKAGSVVFDNLALLFAMGVAIGMAKKEKEVAALSGAIAYLIMNSTISALITSRGGVDAMAANSTTSTLGITTLQMGVFGGIIVGLGVAALHNRFYKIKLPQVLSFFGGTRFVPIISSLVYLGVGILMFFIWPPVQNGISMLGQLVLSSGYAGTWIYGIIERALIPFGLHHVFYMPFWQTELGGAAVINGVAVQGAQNIFFAELAAGVDRFSVAATRFMSGKFPFMIFGLPAAALAIYKTARTEKKRMVGGLLLSAALTSMLTGITEPLEFTFLFVAPALYVVHCVLAGLSYMLMHIFGVGVGMTFSGGVIDLTLFGILQGNARTNWVWIVIVGAFYAAVYYLLFYFLIKHFDFKTPGRELDGEQSRLYTRADYEARGKSAHTEHTASALILKGLGGVDNLSDLDCCATRLRVSVLDESKIDEELLRQSGASGVIRKGNGVQIIYGPRVSVIRSELDEYIDSLEGGSGTRSTLYAHTCGRAIPLSEVADDAFSGGALGKGLAIVPSVGELYAPCDATVFSVFEAQHAINLTSKDGQEILLHVGIDTVKLGGRHFCAKVSKGQRVRRGELLLTFDIEKLVGEGFDVTTPLVICNSESYSEIKVIASGEVCKDDATVIIDG